MRFEGNKEDTTDDKQSRYRVTRNFFCENVQIFFCCNDSYGKVE